MNESIMEEHKLLNAERSDFFLKPIPRWVTLYGFVILTVLVTLVVVLSLFFKVPHIIHLKVYVTKDSIFAISNFAQLEEIKNIKKIEIQLPTR